ncbi:hypothetical protein [Roseofilum capinflatum]|uniref:NERD domain-containing protein n=1 Tax=Roseofilum capinflatum BLCC-M114 TaxID=3022440 RepID=A0ABT7B807_9CYAN|nr:hypothetical protein [Roseofilum capinflatum]MDJ1174413.1 hypothetical protein [Roseofilum capinflatum BLCC-M114]
MVISYVNSIEDLDKLEKYIQNKFKKIKFGNFLFSLHQLKRQNAKIEPFVAAGASLFACQFCCPSKSSQKVINLDIRSLINICKNYYLADPITLDRSLEKYFLSSNPGFLMLRLASHQFPFEPDYFGQFSRPSWLFTKMPSQLENSLGIQNFYFEDKFQSINQCSVIDFITTSFIAWVGLHHNFSISHEYFTKARKQGINLPNDRVIRSIINTISADKYKLTKRYEELKNKDRRFRMYDFNPLLEYPIIKPCQDKQFSTKNFLHAPIPDLIVSRIGTGIFYQMFNEYGTEFSKYFGYVFEHYVGTVLKHSTPSNTVLSEADVRQVYQGKCPDWIIIDGSTVILFECKATRFSREAQAIASEDAVNKSLKQVIKGLKQLHSFIHKGSKCPAINQMLNCCNTFKPIFVSLEPLYLINSNSFREHINSLLRNENITNFEWMILSIQQLEHLQPHIASGVSISEILYNVYNKGFDNVIQDLEAKTGKRFVDSFLYSEQEQLYKKLNILH